MKTFAAALLLSYFANGQGPAMPAGPTFNAPGTPVAPPPPAGGAQAPGGGAAPPAAGAPAAAAPPAQLPPLIPLDAGSLSCAGVMCAGRTIEIRPAQDWSFDCPGDCRDMTLNIRVGTDPQNPGRAVTRLGTIKCNGRFSCQGATVNIYNDNGMMAEAVQLGEVICEAPGACQCMAIHSYGHTDIWVADFSCSMPLSCVGCVVKDNMKLEACDANNNPTGQLMMPWQSQCTGRKPVAEIQKEWSQAQQMHFQQAQILAQQQGMQNTNYPQQQYGAPTFQQPAPQVPVYQPPTQPAQPAQPAYQPPAQQPPVYQQPPQQSYYPQYYQPQFPGYPGYPGYQQQQWQYGWQP